MQSRLQNISTYLHKKGYSIAGSLITLSMKLATFVDLLLYSEIIDLPGGVLSEQVQLLIAL
jgi:hypothetical protein